MYLIVRILAVVSIAVAAYLLILGYRYLKIWLAKNKNKQVKEDQFSVDKVLLDKDSQLLHIYLSNNKDQQIVFEFLNLDYKLLFKTEGITKPKGKHYVKLDINSNLNELSYLKIELDDKIITKQIEL